MALSRPLLPFFLLGARLYRNFFFQDLRRKAFRRSLPSFLAGFLAFPFIIGSAPREESLAAKGASNLL